MHVLKLPALSSLLLVALLAGCAPSEARPSASATPTLVSTSAEADISLASCLRERGWSVTVDPSGGVAAEFPNEQLDQYLADNDECGDLTMFREWRDQDYEEIYQGLLEAVDCLESAGYITRAEIPSLQRFIEGRREGEAVWDPYSEISPGELVCALHQCPQPDPIY